MNDFRCRWIACALALLITPSWSGNASPAAPAQSVARGKVVYERFCTSCHGAEGDGRGESADYIYPRPRDFRQGMFKWRSTPSGALPTVSDLEKTIRDGLYGTHMPTWYAIGHRNRLDVISYIQTFSPRWRSEEIPPPIAIPRQPAMNSQSVTSGKALYEKLECAKCHGDTGRGDGPSSHELKNDWGDPIVAADLTAGHFKCGGTPADIYRVFMTGLNGTPMPSYVDSIKPEEAWQLVHYIESLSGNRPPSQFGAGGLPIR